jgi:threonine-phosphate decarboxylase
MTLHGDKALKVAQQLRLAVTKLTDFSANLNPYGPPAGLFKLLRANLKDLKHYPANSDGLTTLIAQANGVESSQIVLGNGSADLIYFLAFFLKPKTALLLEPSFAAYRLSLKAAKTQILTVFTKPKENFLPPLKKLYKQLAKVDAVFLGNPNNPTGYLWEREVLLSLVKEFPQVIFVIDEAFIDFTEQPSLVRESLALSNLIVLRSLTKIFNLPGLRLGYLVAQPQLSEKMQLARPPWAVNSLAVKAGQFLLQQPDFVANSSLKIKQAKQRFSHWLSQINWLKVYPSAANFFLVEAKNGFTSSYLAARLLRDNLILIRDAANFVGLNSKFFRLAVLKPKQNKKLVKILTNFSKDYEEEK